MRVPQTMRRLILTAHIVTSVGWLGAVIAYLALDVAASASQDTATIRAAYLGMDLTIRTVIAPLAVVSVLIGIVSALTSQWGLFTHYWVLVKLLLTLFATLILLLEVQNIRWLAELASTSADPRNLPGSLVHSVGGLIILLTIAILSVYRPRGLTPRGWRAQQRIASEGGSRGG